MMMLMTAALAAAQPAPAHGTMPSHAQHHEMVQGTSGHTGHMGEKQMADCKKCCEEMMAKVHEGHAEHSGRKTP